MKIAIFTDTFLPDVNGVVTSVVNASKKLAKKGHQIYIFTVKSKKEVKINLGKNIHIERFKRMRFIKYPDFTLAMPKYITCLRRIKKIKPDIIHIHTPSLLGWSAILSAKAFSIPIVGTYHTLLPDFLKYFPLPKVEKLKLMKKATWTWTRKFYNRCDLVTTPSLAMKKVLRKHRLKKSITVLSNGIDTNRFKPKKVKKSGTKLLHLGRISYEKNVDVVLKAFKLILERKPKIILYLAGHGPNLKELKALAKKLKINKNVKFLGVVKGKKLVNVYRTSDIFITASTVETEGLVILEAMACGLPIIGVNVLAIPIIVKHNKNGFVAPPHNERQLADYTIKLLENKNLREKFGKESLKIVKKYSLDNIINELERIYKRLIT
ncbi:glycosyltransferase [Candidatus Woesearchaeota archaeon]|nr:glycosyltransferase [Candidatus Woesearchaeota archaeon]